MVDVKPSDYIIGIIIFTIVIVSGITLLAQVNTINPDTIDSDRLGEFNKTFNVLGDITDTTDDLEKSVTESSTEYGIFGVLNSLINSAWNTLKLLFNSFRFMDGVFNGLSVMFGVPVFVAQLIIALITVVIVFGIFGAIFQTNL